MEIVSSNVQTCVERKRVERKNQWVIARPTKESFQEICRILNEPRPYRSSDSKRQHFIPDL